MRGDLLAAQELFVMMYSRKAAKEENKALVIFHL